MRFEPWACFLSMTSEARRSAVPSACVTMPPTARPFLFLHIEPGGERASEAEAQMSNTMTLRPRNDLGVSAQVGTVV